MGKIVEYRTRDGGTLAVSCEKVVDTKDGYVRLEKCSDARAPGILEAIGVKEKERYGDIFLPKSAILSMK